MQEVVKKESIKWLDLRVIYPITANNWVCHDQCVTKKGEMIVVPNEKQDCSSVASDRRKSFHGLPKVECVD